MAGPGRFGHREGASGHRLLHAFAALERLPALAHTRTRLLALFADENAKPEDIVAAIESDAAITIAVLRAGEASNVAGALARLSERDLLALVGDLPVFDFFDRSSLLAAWAGRVRVHAAATQLAAQRISQELDQPMTGSLSTAALLHDVGKVVLAHAYDDYEGLVAVPATPEERVRLERQALGIDHAVAGAVALRRLGLPPELAAAVERHHGVDASGDAGLIRLADMLAHYGAGAAVDPGELSSAASAVGIGGDALRNLLGEPRARDAGVRRTEIDPPPVSGRQLQILRMLRDGKTYKQIAAELDLSASTVRNHIHLAFGRLGVIDRAQAVLLASERGWI